MAMHEGELTVTVPTVRELVDAQFPQWRSLPVRAVASEGTVNAIFRLGDGLAARFPLLPGDAEAARRQLAGEADAARELAAATRFPVPEPVALGRPGAGYPMPWSVQTWLPGRTASVEDPGASAGFARDLVELIHEIRSIATRGRTFRGRGRGGDLRAHDAWVAESLGRSEGLLDVPRLRALWLELRDLPRTSPDVMAHGDLVPGNVLVAGGRLAGVLDTGGLAPADPALDLVAAWHLLDDGPRQVLRDGLGCDETEWQRGRAWALEQALGAVWYYTDTNPAMARMGRRTLARVVAARPA